MAASDSTRYHLLPDPRASLDSDDDENAQLIDPAGDNTAPRRAARTKSITFHPTAFTRLLAWMFTFTSFFTFCFRWPDAAVAALVFLGLAWTRQIIILFSFVIGKFVDIKIEITNATFKRTSFVKRAKGLKAGTVAVVVDVVILLGLIPSVTVGMLMAGCIEGGVLGYFGIIFLILSVIDAGSPTTVTASLRKPVGAAWEVSHVGRLQAAGPANPDMERIFGKVPQEPAEVTPGEGPSDGSVMV